MRVGLESRNIGQKIQNMPNSNYVYAGLSNKQVFKNFGRETRENRNVWNFGRES